MSVKCVLVLVLVLLAGIECESENVTTTTERSNNVTTTAPVNTETTTMGDNNRTSFGRAVNMTMLLQDLNLDDIDMSSMTTTPTPAPKKPEGCVDGGEKYTVGDKWNRGCDQSCQCRSAGEVDCRPRCDKPMYRKGSNVDTSCVEKPSDVDTCCSLLVCMQDLEFDAVMDSEDGATERPGACIYKKQSYQKGETISDGCEAVCTCGDSGNVTCKPRCPTANTTVSEHCVSLPDPNDPCCSVVLCDVGATDHETSPAIADLHVLTAQQVNATSVLLELAEETPSNFSVESSDDLQGWREQRSQGLLVTELTPGKSVYLRIKAGGVVSNAVEVLIPKVDTTGVNKDGCVFNGKNYTLGEEFHDGCKAYCLCSPSGIQCADIECPTDFGLDVLDPTCVAWENVPKDFVASPPLCCPESVRCKDNGSCVYAGQSFANWADLPISLTGCEKRCYCEFGNVSCQAACPPVPATPPADLACPPQLAVLSHLQGDDCCKYWLCPQPRPGFPGGTGLPSGHAAQHDEVTVQTLEAVDETTIRLVFSVPPVLVGLHGHVELRYTPDIKNTDENTWEQQVLAPPDGLITTQQLEFELGGLQVDTMYKIKISVLLRDIGTSPTSAILTVRTSPASTPSTTLPPQIPVDANLEMVQVNATLVQLRWRKLSDNELQFVDGVQLRYKEVDGKVYAATPLIHRAVTTYTLEDLKPNTSYEVSIFFIPFPGQTTELQNERSVQIVTAEIQDLYKFSVQLEVHHIKSQSVEISWSGVPYPEDKYVNIFRAIYQSESGKEDLSNFKVAKRDTQAVQMITDLKPGTRYRLWLEVYLTNGRIKKSNVQDFITKPGAQGSSGTSQQGKLERAEPTLEAGNYYGPLVAVAILAALAILATLILLLILFRKYGQNKAAISSAHPTRAAHQAAYDNPSYKVEIQQETMDL